MATSATNPAIGSNVNDEQLVSEAYERVKADLAKLDPGELIQVNLEIPVAVGTILGVSPEVKALRDQIVKELPGFDLASFDKLEDYALALSFAHTTFLTATRPADDLQALADEATVLRETLAADANALAKRHLIDSAQLAQLKGANGYKNLAQDLQILSKVMQDAWAQIQGKSATTTDDLQTASRMSTRLTRIVGLREQGPAQLAEVTEQRLRAFTQALNVYEDARRAVAYLRGRAGDADTIAPSLYPGRPRRRNTEPDAPTPPATTPTAGSATSVAPASAGSTTAPMPSVTPAQLAAAAAAQKGAPASKDPFIS